MKADNHPPRLGKALSKRAMVCFECELPECLEDSEGCKYYHLSAETQTERGEQDDDV